MYFMNRETGELLTLPEMLEQAVEEYDLNDPTNVMTLFDYYQLAV